jgi:mannosyltransferase
LLAAVAALLRWSGLAAQSLWWDEGYTLWVCSFSPREIWHVLSTEQTPPLYYVLLRCWMSWFGSSDAALRSLSALFGIASIPLVYSIARKVLVDKKSVILAMLLYAVSFYQIWYAKEARCYALLGFLSAGIVYYILRSIEKPSLVHLSVLVLCLAASLYTHNMAFFYLPGAALLWMIYPGEMRIRSRIRDATIVFSATLFLYLPWVPNLRSQMRIIQRGFWVPVPKARDLLDSLSVLLGLDTRTFQTVSRDLFRVHNAKLFGFWTWAPVIFAVFLVCVVGGFYKVLPADRRRTVAILAYSVLPIVLVFTYSHFSNPVYINRAFLGSCVPLSLAVCVPIAFQTGRRKIWFQVIGTMVAVGAALSAWGYLRQEQKEDWRGVAEQLAKLPKTRRVVVVVPNHGQMLISHYAPEISGITGLDAPDALYKLGNPNAVRRTDPVTVVSQALATGDYEEIDVVMHTYGYMQADGIPVREFLAKQCGTVNITEFHLLEIQRCLTTPIPSNGEEPAKGGE